MNKSLSTTLAWVLFAIATGIYLIVVGRAVFFGFVTDDFALVNYSYSEAIHHTLHGVHFRPIWLLSYPFVNSLFGQSALAHHVANFLLHLANCVLAFHVLRFRLGTGKAVGAVLCWIALPQTAYPVVWIAQRNDALMAFFLLLGLIAMDKGRHYSGYLLILLAFFSKVTCMFFPLALLTVKGLRQSRTDLIAGLILLAVTLSVSAYALQYLPPSDHLANLGPAMKVANYAKNLVLGWVILLVPFPYFAFPLPVLAYAIFAMGTAWLLLACRARSAVTVELLVFASTMSLPLAMTNEIRITYLQGLFLVGAIFSAIDLGAILARSGARAILAITLSAYLLYALPAAYLVVNGFRSDEYDVSAPPLKPTRKDYPVDFYGWIRDAQKRLLKREAASLDPATHGRTRHA